MIANPEERKSHRITNPMKQGKYSVKDVKDFRPFCKTLRE